MNMGAVGGKNSVNPTVVITSTESSPTSADPIPITFTWSEGVYSFGSADVDITNGTVSTVIVHGQDLYVMEVNPTAPGDVIVSVPAGGCYDIDGNLNLASDTFTIEAS